MDKINTLEAYIFSKKLISNDFKLSSRDRIALFDNLQEKINSSHLGEIQTAINLISNQNKKKGYTEICRILLNQHSSHIFLCSLLFIVVKEAIMAKKDHHTKEYFDLLGAVSESTPHQKLNLKYDHATVLFPYALRVGLVNTLHDENISRPIIISQCAKLTQTRQDEIIRLFSLLVPYFQITFDESVRQSGISSSGTDYETRIEDLLKALGLPYEKHQHEGNLASDQEHDFIFTLDNKKFGIGAKRTLRERYKQYNPQGVDVAIVFTIGLDLGEDKVQRMTVNYNQKIFIADEVYQSTSYLKNNSHVFPVSQFKIELLRSFVNN